MNPDNDLAVQGSAVVNGNLFVVSWVSFILSWILLKLVLEQLHVMHQARSGNLAYLTPARASFPPLIPLTMSRLVHIGLICSSLVVLVASARSYKQEFCHDWNRQVSVSFILFVRLHCLSPRFRRFSQSLSLLAA